MIPSAYYPRTLLIVCQFLMMGAQSYSYSGKPESVEWLVKNARGKSRMSNCDLTRVGRGNRPIKYSDFFDNQTQPNDISDADWLTMAEKAYDCILDCMNDEKLQYLLAGIESGDGRGLINRLQNICGNKQQRMDQIDADIENQTAATITQWSAFRDKLSDLLRKRNLIPGLQDNEKESDAKHVDGRTW